MSSDDKVSVRVPPISSSDNNINILNNEEIQVEAVVIEEDEEREEFTNVKQCEIDFSVYSDF